MVGVAFAIEDGPSYYLPMRHHGGDNLPVEQVLGYLRDQAKEYNGIVVGANLGYDLDYTEEEGILFGPNVRFRDIQVADAVLFELHQSYKLDAIASRWELPGKDETLLRAAAKNYGVDPKRGLWQLPARYVGAYGERDVQLPLHILRKQERHIEEQDLWSVYDLESALLPVLLRMRRRGIRVDLDALDRFTVMAQKLEQQHLRRIKHLTNINVDSEDLWRKGALVLALEAAGIVLKTTPTGQPAIDKSLLRSAEHPVAEAVLRARQCNKARTTFVKSIRDHMVGDRVHCIMNQLRGSRKEGNDAGARFGRMSSEHPNLQQQLSKGELAKPWRSIFVPDKPLWFCADFSQQEPRMLTHFAELCNLTGAKAAGDRYRTDPKTDNHQMMAELCSIPRDPAKMIYLGLCYGMGGAKLAHSLGLPTKWITTSRGRVEVAGDEAQALLDKFDARAPFVRQLARLAERIASHRGYIVTLLGRRLHFPQRPDGSYDWAHKALNRLIQGSSADQTKLAMVQADRAGFYMQAQVHDELDGSIDTVDEGRQLAKIMVECVALRVPSRVDLEVGQSWGELKDVA